MRKGLLAALAAGTLTAVAVPTAAKAQSSLLPWPNDTFTVREQSTDTGRRLNLPRDSMPATRPGSPLTPRT